MSRTVILIADAKNGRIHIRGERSADVGNFAPLEAPKAARAIIDYMDAASATSFEMLSSSSMDFPEEYGLTRNDADTFMQVLGAIFVNITTPPASFTKDDMAKCLVLFRSLEVGSIAVTPLVRAADSLVSLLQHNHDGSDIRVQASRASAGFALLFARIEAGRHVGEPSATLDDAEAALMALVRLAPEVA